MAGRGWGGLRAAAIAGSLALAACSPAQLLRGEPAQQAQWVIDPAAEVTPASTQIPLLVVETDCASGQDARGRISIDVEDGAEQITITAWVTPLGGDQACPSNPPTPFLLELPTPIGERQLVNGATDEIARRPVDLPGDGPAPDDGPARSAVVDSETLDERQLFLVEALHARGRDASELADLGDLSLAPTVELFLGTDIKRTVSRVDLGDPSSWTIRAEAFAGRSGEFSALAALGGAAQVAATVGARAHCSGPERPPPVGLEDLVRIAITPVDAATCLDWFVVNVYVQDGLVRAIQLDLSEP